MTVALPTPRTKNTVVGPPPPFAASEGVEARKVLGADDVLLDQLGRFDDVDRDRDALAAFLGALGRHDNVEDAALVRVLHAVVGRRLGFLCRSGGRGQKRRTARLATR